MAFKKTIKRKKGERYNHTTVEANGLKFDSKKEYQRDTGVNLKPFPITKTGII